MRINFILALMAMSFLVAVSCSDPGSSTPPTSIGGGSNHSASSAAAGEAQDAPKGASTAEAFPADGEQSSRRNFYFVFDGSGSMSGKLEQAKEAVQAFMRSVPTDVNLGLFVFDSQGTREVIPLGANNRAAFLRAVNEVRQGGGTPLDQGILAGCNSLLTQYKKQLGYGEYRLVVVTDGAPDDNSRFHRACEYAAKAKVPIYAIGYQVPGGNHPLRDKRYTVSYREASDAKSLQQGLEEVLAETETFDAQSFEELFKLMESDKK